VEFYHGFEVSILDRLILKVSIYNFLYSDSVTTCTLGWLYELQCSLLVNGVMWEHYSVTK